MSEQEKNCPFCGRYEDSHELDCYFVLRAVDAPYDDQIAAWNRRAPASEPAVDRVAELKLQMSRMRGVFHVNMMRAHPGKSHEEIAAAIDGAIERSGWLATPAAPAVPAAPLVAKNFEDRMNEAALKPFPFAWRPNLAPQGAQSSGNSGELPMVPSPMREPSGNSGELADHINDSVEMVGKYKSPEFDGIVAQGAQASPWISVEDRLPDFEGEVLAVWKAGRLADNLVQTMVTTIAYLLNHPENFTHWVPLPAPPRTTGNNTSQGDA